MSKTFDVWCPTADVSADWKSTPPWSLGSFPDSLRLGKNWRKTATESMTPTASASCRCVWGSNGPGSGQDLVFVSCLSSGVRVMFCYILHCLTAGEWVSGCDSFITVTHLWSVKTTTTCLKKVQTCWSEPWRKMFWRRKNTQGPLFCNILQFLCKYTVLKDVLCELKAFWFWGN